MPRPKRKQPSWEPATEFKVTRLERNGPKEGQSTEAWLYGKRRSDKRWEEIKMQNIEKLL
jgi:hypothetical protein